MTSASDENESGCPSRTDAIRGRSVLGRRGRIGAESAKRKNNPDRGGELVVRVKSRKVRIRKKKKRKERLTLESRREGGKREGEGKEAEMKVDYLITTEYFSGSGRGRNDRQNNNLPVFYLLPIPSFLLS